MSQSMIQVDESTLYLWQVQTLPEFDRRIENMRKMTITIFAFIFYFCVGIGFGILITSGGDEETRVGITSLIGVILCLSVWFTLLFVYSHFHRKQIILEKNIGQSWSNGKTSNLQTTDQPTTKTE